MDSRTFAGPWSAVQCLVIDGPYTTASVGDVAGEGPTDYGVRYRDSVFVFDDHDRLTEVEGREDSR